MVAVLVHTTSNHNNLHAGRQRRGSIISLSLYGLPPVYIWLLAYVFHLILMPTCYRFCLVGGF